ncbi:DNA-formamidopyrimidine glycosylase [Cohnella rhizosphaerae]|uniref:Formamidopyrimidine-DNA glycosylase n=1 Tax=Cohnella rhizosphaerae TaxID=1457232 RepID=A0A9X4KPJ5_9BACL|nr:DNA-formamidopyrimidine glycosylase [Cohnella rhizosphaerae]MDG0808238.1 DNA-formamidopyrimidine glycosylase [Cohnella rhizosphaerae]
MPELPEVETVRRTLSELIVGKRIRAVTVRLPRILQKPDDPDLFGAMLEGRTFTAVERRGKFLRLMLDGLVLVSHLRMEGRYGLFADDAPLDKHTHVIFHFTDGTALRYTDVRQFGTMHLFPAGEELASPPLAKLGLEPLEAGFTAEALRGSLGRRNTKIKPLLLNQEWIVGLGNIYVDEALHLAGIHPERMAGELKPKDWRRLHEAIVTTLTAAVEAGGSSVKSYVNGQGEMGMFQHRLRVYGRTGEACPACGHPIAKSVVGGRGTHVCAKCQKPPKGAAGPASGVSAAASKRYRESGSAVKRRLDGAVASES